MTERPWSHASAEERAHLAAIGAAEAESEAERIEAALRTPAAERIRIGLELGLAELWTPAHLAEIDTQADGQLELARRRVALGLASDRGKFRQTVRDYLDTVVLLERLGPGAEAALRPFDDIYRQRSGASPLSEVAERLAAAAPHDLAGVDLPPYLCHGV